MSEEGWIAVPFGIDAARWNTGTGRRVVLMAVHSITAATRLMDVLPLLESDLRIQIVFTQAPSSFPGGVADFLHRLNAVTVPWVQATRERFDLAIAASSSRLEELHAPVLRLPHGVGHGKYPDHWHGHGPLAPRAAWGLERRQLVYHGRVIPSALVLPHREWRSQLERSCPEALPAAVIAGDPAYDRLVASLPYRRQYRRALGVADEETLVVISSTWGPQSLHARHPDLPARLVAELSGKGYRIAAVLHPNIWHHHGPWQVRTWYADCLRRGIALIPPEEGWRAALIAADRVIGDHGSVTYYAASIKVPTVLGTYPDGAIDPDSQVAAIGAVAPRLRWHEPLAPQLERAVDAYSPALFARLAERVTSEPGQSARILRRTIYRLIRLPEPSGVPCAQPVPVPCPITAASVDGVA